MTSQTVKTNTYRIKEVLSVQCSSPLKTEPCAANLGSNACQLASALRIIGALWHDYHRHKRLTAGHSFVSLDRLDCPPLPRLCFPPVCKFNESVKRIFVGKAKVSNRGDGSQTQHRLMSTHSDPFKQSHKFSSNEEDIKFFILQ